MKVVVATDNGVVTEHFGHCSEFILYDIENETIVREEAIPNPGHKPGFIPVFLKERGVELVVSGGIGKNALTIFDKAGITVITGASGEPKEAALEALRGNITSLGATCGDHHHAKSDCGGGCGSGCGGGCSH